MTIPSQNVVLFLGGRLSLPGSRLKSLRSCGCITPQQPVQMPRIVSRILLSQARSRACALRSASVASCSRFKGGRSEGVLARDVGSRVGRGCAIAGSGNAARRAKATVMAERMRCPGLSRQHTLAPRYRLIGHILKAARSRAGRGPEGVRIVRAFSRLCSITYVGPSFSGGRQGVMKTSITGIASGPSDSIERMMRYLANKPDVTLKPASARRKAKAAPFRRELKAETPGA